MSMLSKIVKNRYCWQMWLRLALLPVAFVFLCLGEASKFVVKKIDSLPRVPN
jgi:hypothetical protein